MHVKTEEAPKTAVLSVKLVECLDWDCQDRPGEMLKYAEQFQIEGIDLDAFWAYTPRTETPKLAAIAKNAANLRSALKRLGVTPRSSRCFTLCGKDRAGALIPALKVLADAGVNVEFADALAGLGTFTAAIWVKDADLGKARKLLKAA
ncbi:MAG: hypothetical protein HY924_12105 [Elusimicrobia bacterium]|nr:hypothetical protein [Elusimicrobiota bacterium]